MPSGRPNIYLPFLAALGDKDIYCPATIVDHGLRSGLFDQYLDLHLPNEKQLRRSIRHTMARFAKNHGFPPEGDGFTTQKCKGRPEMVGWCGFRWKQAARLLSQENEQTQNEAISLLEPVNILKPKDLLAKDGLFYLADVADILKFNATALVDAALVLIRGNLSPWEYLGLVPMVDNRWLVYMPAFAAFYNKSLKGKRRVDQWNVNRFLGALDIYPLTKVKSLLKFIPPKEMRKMTVKQKREYGIWAAPQVSGFVAHKGTLLKRQPK